MLRQISLISLLFFLLSALVMLDFNAAQRAALTDQHRPPGFGDHLLGIGGRVLAVILDGFGQDSAETSERLTLMLPVVPEGWQDRATTDEDRAALFARKPKDDDPQTVSLIDSILANRGPRGGEVARRAYASEDGLVVFKLVRQPDALFSDPERLGDLDALIKAEPTWDSRSFLRVRGLDVVELVLPEKMRARVFTAELGGQLRLWVASSGRLADTDLLTFFETLDVAAMNASVRVREDGLGAVPVIVLASDLGEEDLAAYEADRAARQQDRQRGLEELRAALAARANPADPDAGADGPTDGCSVAVSGFTLCVSGG